MTIRGLDRWLTTPPDEDEGPCEVCGRMVDDCICPECQECGSTGDPACYEKHGLKKTQEQIDSLAAMNKYYEEQNAREAAAMQEMHEEFMCDDTYLPECMTHRQAQELLAEHEQIHPRRKRKGVK